MNAPASTMIDPAAFACNRDLDGAVSTLEGLVDRYLGGENVRAVFGGKWFGHPVHPMLTDVVIGMWTSASLLDLGGQRTATAARRFVALGVVAAVPTMLAGLVDWRTTSQEAKRLGVVHAASNATALSLYLLSLRLRRHDRRLMGAATALAGMGVATFGGLLGGHLAFGEIPHEDDRPDSQDVKAKVEQVSLSA